MSNENTLPGFNLLAFEQLPGYEPDAILYAVLNNQDHTVALSTLVEFILQGVTAAQLPEDMVLRQAMEDYVTARILAIELPSGGEVSEAEFSNKVAAVEGIIALKEGLQAIQDTLSGISIPSIEGFVKASEGIVAGRAVTFNEAQELINVNLGSTRVLYVARRTVASGALKNGSLEAPFVEIQEAIDSVPPSYSNVVIMVMPSESGSYQGFTVSGRVNTSVFGYGCTDAHMVKIEGSVKVEGGGGTRFRMKDVQIKQTNTGLPAYHSVGTQARDYLKNVTIEPVSGAQVTPIVILEDVNNWIDFEDCNLGGKVSIIGTAGTNALVAMRSGNATTTHVNLDSNVKLLVNNCTRFGSIEQFDGTVEVNYSHTFTGKNGFALISEGGEASMNYTNLKKTDGSFLKIKRATGLNPVQLLNVALGTVQTEGPVVHLEDTSVQRATDPVFAFTPGPVVEGSRQASLVRLMTKGYYYDTLNGQVVQVAAGGDPTTGTNTTDFTLTYTEKNKVVEYPVAEDLPEVYVLLKDPENNDRTFVFGPYSN